MLQPNDVVDRYVVEEILGQGGMALVYRVRHQQLGTLHALKILSIEAGGAQRRLLAEGRAQAQLDHPNAVAVSDVIEVDGRAALVMEYLEGGSLEDWLLTDPTPAARLKVFAQICDAVAAAHQRGWVHRDLKPANVLMKPTDRGPVPKVADFGIVKLVGEPGTRTGTRSGSMMGTPGYMAPEQIDDASSVDARADVFSLGCLLYWILTGKPAFEGDTALELLGNVASDRHRHLPANHAQRDLVERCLARRPADRPADAAVVLELLKTPRTPSATSWLQPGLLVAIVGLGFAGLAIAGGIALGLLWTTVTPSPGSPGMPRMPTFGGTTTDCKLTERRHGYVRLDDRGRYPIGTVITLPEAAPVLADPRQDGSVVCTLPAGTVLETPELVRKGWFPVYGPQTRLP